MRSLLSRSLEYLLLLLLAVALLVAVVIVRASSDEAEPSSVSAAPGATTATTARPAVPPCSASKGARTCRTDGATVTLGAAGERLRAAGVRVRVRSASAALPDTAAGRARQRMRISVRLALTNERPTAFRPSGGAGGVFILADGERVASDPAARRLPGALRLAEPLPAGTQRDGLLRFELAGGQTAAVRRAKHAQLRVAVASDRLIGVRLRFPDLDAG